MKIGMITDSLGGLSFDEMIDAAGELRLQALEFACGNWSGAPHLQLAKMLDDEAARKQFIARVRGAGCEISALNCSGNQLHPGPTGKLHDAVVRDTIRLASLMGVERVVLMSGLPGGPGDANPNWIITDWPVECQQILEWQWNERIIPYWKDLVAYANNLGIRKLCIELHGHQAVYNVSSLLRLREAVGETVGANYDPSHPMWMGADPLRSVRQLAGAIYHVHAKDTRIEPAVADLDGVLDARPGSDYRNRAWNYITLGYGHGETWWKQFCTELNIAGYDDVLSIEHEDMMMSPMEGMRKSIAVLHKAAIGVH